MSADLFDAVIPGFALHWDLDDLVKAMGARPVLWTDPTDWMRRVVALGPRIGIATFWAMLRTLPTRRTTSLSTNCCDKEARCHASLVLSEL